MSFSPLPSIDTQQSNPFGSVPSGKECLSPPCPTSPSTTRPQAYLMQLPAMQLDRLDANSIVKLFSAELQVHTDRIDKKLEELRVLTIRVGKKKTSRRGQLRALAGASDLPPLNGYFSEAGYASQGSAQTNVVYPSAKTGGTHRTDTKEERSLPCSPATTVTSPKVVKRQEDAMLQDLISRHRKARGRLAQDVWRFIESPLSSTLSRVYALCFHLIIIISVLFAVWQTSDEYPIGHHDLVPCLFESIFALELSVRFCVCPDRRDFATDPFNYLDLLSALPLVFRICMAIAASDGYIGAEDELPWIGNFLPAVRLLKLTRRFEKLRLLLNAFVLAVEALPVLLYTLSIIALIFAGLVCRVEPTDNIEDMPKALWFVLVTMTTVGYGDKTPVTVAGYIVTTVLILFSVLYMAIPIGIVGHAFSQVWSARDKLLLMQRMRAEFLQQGFAEKALSDIVMAFDTNGDGELCPDEFQKMLQEMHIHMSDERIFMLMESLDDDCSGTINVGELITGLFPRFNQFFSPPIEVSATPNRPSFQKRLSQFTTRPSQFTLPGSLPRSINSRVPSSTTSPRDCTSPTTSSLPERGWLS